MDTREQTRAREDKVRLVGTILDRAGLARLYDSISVAEAERLYEALMDHASEVARRAVGLAPEDVPGRREAAVTRIVVARDNAVPYGQDFCFSRGIPAGAVWDVRDGPRSELVRLTADGFGHGIPGRPAGAYGDGALSVRRADLEAALAEGQAHRIS